MNSKLQKWVFLCFLFVMIFQNDSILFGYCYWECYSVYRLICSYFFIVLFLSIDAVMRKRYHLVTKWDKHEPNRKCFLNIIVVLFMRAFTLPLSLSLSFILFLSFTSSCLFVMLSLGAITFLRNALKNIYFDPQQWFWQRQTHLLGHFVCLLREVYTPPHNLFALCRAEFFLSLFFRQIPRLSLIHSHHIYIFHEFSNNINIWHMRHSFNVSFWQFNFFSFPFLTLWRFFSYS